MTKNKAVLLFSLSFLVSCARVPSQPVALTDRAPELLYVVPSDDAQVSQDPTWAIFFSKPVDPETVTADSILLTDGIADLSPYRKPDDLFKGIDKGNLSSLPVVYSVREDGKVVLIRPEKPLQPDASYSLVVTSRVMSFEKLPLKMQDVCFTASYRSVSVSPQAESPSSNPEATASSSQSISEGIPVEETDPQVPDPASPSKDEVETEPAAVTSGKVVINEIYYDAVGSDTDGVVFVELYGTAALHLADMKLNFINGDDGKIYDGITLPPEAVLDDLGFYMIADSRTGATGVSQVTSAALIDNFDPQNGPDAVQLLSAKGELLDAVGYGVGIVAQTADGFAAFEGSPATDVVNGHSLGRRENGLDTNDNQSDFIEFETPTPGT